MTEAGSGDFGSGQGRATAKVGSVGAGGVEGARQWLSDEFLRRREERIIGRLDATEARLDADHEARRVYRRCILGVVFVWLVFVLGMVGGAAVFSGFLVPDNVQIALVASATALCLGLFVVIGQLLGRGG